MIIDLFMISKTYMESRYELLKRNIIGYNTKLKELYTLKRRDHSYVRKCKLDLIEVNKKIDALLASKTESDEFDVLYQQKKEYTEYITNINANIKQYVNEILDNLSWLQQCEAEIKKLNVDVDVNVDEQC